MRAWFARAHWFDWSYGQLSGYAGICALVLENGGDEDQAIAALLHDLILPALRPIYEIIEKQL